MKTIGVLLKLALPILLGACTSGSSPRSPSIDAAGVSGGEDTSSGAQGNRDGGASPDTSVVSVFPDSRVSVVSDTSVVGVALDTRVVDVSPDAGNTGGPDSGMVTALDPSVPIPSHDCRNDTNANCISVAGTYNGQTIDVFCNSEDLTVIIHAGKWVIGCDHVNSGFARLYIPIQRPGSFSETATPVPGPHIGEGSGMAFELSTDNMPPLALFTANLVRADVAGTIVVETAPNRTVSGTFHGEWATPDATCRGYAGMACVPANLNATFRLRTRYGSCFGDDDCKPPATCDKVASYCY